MKEKELLDCNIQLLVTMMCQLPSVPHVFDICLGIYRQNLHL